MEAKYFEIAQKNILNAIDNLQGRIEAIALLQMVDEFYTKEERTELYSQYRALTEASTLAQQKIQESRPKDSLTWTERVEQFGEEVANQHFEPYNRAVETSSTASKKVTEFNQAHPLIAQLLNIKKTLSNSKIL